MTFGTIAFRSIVAAVYGFLLMPLIYMLINSFNLSPVLEFPPTGFTTQWFFKIPPDFWSALSMSIWVGLATSLLATVFGASIAMFLLRGYLPGLRVIGALCLSPLMVPTLVIAIALLQGFVAVWALTGVMLGGNAGAIVAGHVIMTLPIVIRAVMAAHAHFDPAIEEASLSLAATPLVTFRKVTLRGLMPGIASGAIFSFLLSLEDVPIAYFVGSGAQPTFPLKVFQTIEFSLNPSVMAISSLVTFGSLILVLVVQKTISLDVVFGLKGR